MGWSARPFQVSLPASGPFSSPVAAEWGGSAGQVHSAHLPPCQAPTVLVYLETVQKTILWWVLAQVTYMKQSLQRYHYLWRKVGKELLRWEFSKVWEGGRGLVAPSCQNWDSVFNYGCHIYHSAKHWFDHTPGLGTTKKFKMSHSNLNFFPEGREKVVTHTHEQLYHMDGNTFL